MSKLPETMRELAAEGVLIIAGGRAILLQLANPAIGHGVAHHSDFANRPLARLHGTLMYVYAVACGTAEEIAFVTARVNEAHRPVHSRSDGDSPAYNAFTPQLQLWVAATLYDSALSMHERIYGPLTPSVAENIFTEYGQLGSTLQMPPGLWPADRSAFDLYWNTQLSTLHTDATTRAVAHQLLNPERGPLVLRAVMPLARFVTAGLLSPELRTLFELPWSRWAETRFRLLMGLTRRVYPKLPGAIRHWPRNYYLRQLRAAMAPAAT